MVGYVLVAAGLPLPFGAAPVAGDAASKRLATKDRSRPFPCMDKPCGCTTAEQCFSNCCCNSPAELLAWARAKRASPDVLVALDRRAAPPAAGRPARAGCCAAAARPACCAAAARPACCAEACPAPVVAPPPSTAPQDEPASVRGVSLRALLACGGIVAEWLTVAAAPPPQPVRAATAAVHPIAVLIPGDESPLAERAAPDGPPPRAT